jgi:hypothetical protein
MSLYWGVKNNNYISWDLWMRLTPFIILANKKTVK